MASHLGRMAAITLLIVLCIFYPFLPGEYDGLALGLSAMARTLATVGLLLVPIGLLWQIHELRSQAKRKQGRPHADRGYRFAVTAMVAASVVAAAMSIAATISIGHSFGILWIGAWIYAVTRVLPPLKRLRHAERASVNPVPLYLTVIPVATVLAQFTLAGPAVERSRNRAIANSAEIIEDIERFRTARGRYPESLLAVWPDYKPRIVGIERFHYAPQGDAYNLAFEQPGFRWGTREIVMYNKLDQQFMPSHAEWNTRATPEELRGREGWYAVHEASRPHWKYFWFD